MVLELLDDFVVLTQFDPLFTQALVGRELVKRQVLRAPTRVGTFVETTVHVRRHRVVVVVVVRAAAFGGRAAAAAAMRYGTSLLCSGAHARTSRETGPSVVNLRRAPPKSEEIFFFLN